GVLGTLEIEREPLLDASPACPTRQVREENQIEHERCSENGVTTQEVDLHLHRVPEPAKDVQVVPTLFTVTSRRVVVDPDLVIDVAIEVGVEAGLEDLLEHAELALLLGSEAVRVVEHLAVAVAQDVRRIPAAEPKHAGLQHRSDDRLHERLPSLEVLATDRNLTFVGTVHQRRDVN